MACPVTRYAWLQWRHVRVAGGLAVMALVAAGCAAVFTTSGHDVNSPHPPGSAGMVGRLHARLTSHQAAASAPAPAVSNEPRGLVELLGDRTPLVQQDDHNPSTLSSWAPAAPWYDLQEIGTHFPQCAPPDPTDCDASWYAPHTTAAVQAALWATQNPADCDRARFLVLDSSYPSGLGSSLHIHMYMLALAIRCVGVGVRGLCALVPSHFFPPSFSTAPPPNKKQ